MRDLSATELARNLSDLLDAVEHGRESFRITRGGRVIGTLSPAEPASGRAIKALLERHHPDRAWPEELASLRGLLLSEERPWDG